MVVRSLLYNALFYVITLTMLIVFSPVLLGGRRSTMAIVRLWSRITMGLHRALTGIPHELRGFDRLPEGGAIVAVKHQSTWETIALLPHLHDPVFILKRELMWIPLFGWWAWVADMVPVTRGRGAEALQDMTRKAREAVAKGRQILIFPEGTRREAGAEPAYKFGVALLYRDLGVPLVPVALNAGCAWPRRSRIQRRGTIVAEVLEPIPPGLEARTAFTRLQQAIESATDRLLLESAARGDDLPPSAAARVEALKAGAGPRLTKELRRAS